MEEKNRINKFIEAVMKVARGDYSAQIEPSGKNDDLDSLAVGINMIIDDTRNKITEHKRAEEELTSSEERLRILFEYAPDAYYLNDLKGIFIDGNKAAENMMGYKSQELIGKSFLKLKLLSLEQIPKAAKLLANNALGKPTGPDEFILKRKDGSRVTAEIRTFPVKIKGKTLVLGIARDITVRQKAEEELKAMNEELRSTNEILQKREHELGERIKELNGLYGVSKLVSEPGISLEEIFQGIVDIIPPSLQYPEITCARILLYDQEFRTKNFKKTTWMLASDIIMNSEQIGTLEMCYLRKKPEIDEGPFLKEERNLINAIAERVGKVIESKRAEEAMWIKDTAIASSINAIAIADLEGTLTYINNSFLELWGYEDEKDVLGKPAAQFWKIEEKAQEVVRSLRDKGHWMGELATKRKDGSLFDVQLSSTVVKDNAGRPLCMMASFEDITERKRAEEQIKKSLEEKEFLLSEIHHRVKNNMQVISSLLRIQSSNIKDEKILEMFNVIHGRIRSMSLLYEMLYKSRDMARIDLSEYIRELTTHLFSMYRAKVGPVSLKLNVKDVYLDAKRAIPCGLIITELVSNSLKHAFPNGKKGEISVEMFSDRGKKFSLIIRDTGRGFPEGLDFHKTESLGMQLVTGLVDQIDGTIKLNRTKGTEFKIVF